MTDEPMTREQFERFAKFAKGGSGYVERRLVATVHNLYETIDGLYAALEGKDKSE